VCFYNNFEDYII